MGEGDSNNTIPRKSSRRISEKSDKSEGDNNNASNPSNTRKKKKNQQKKSSKGLNNNSADAISDSETSSNTNNKQKARHKKRVPKAENDGVAGIQDSMLVAIKKNRRTKEQAANNTGAVGDTSTGSARRVSLSGSTIARDIHKNRRNNKVTANHSTRTQTHNNLGLSDDDEEKGGKNSRGDNSDAAAPAVAVIGSDSSNTNNNDMLAMAMGKIPRSSFTSRNHGNGVGSQEPTNIGSNSSGGGGGALRPSRYGSKKNVVEVADNHASSSIGSTTNRKKKSQSQPSVRSFGSDSTTDADFEKWLGRTADEFHDNSPSAPSSPSSPQQRNNRTTLARATSANSMGRGSFQSNRRRQSSWRQDSGNIGTSSTKSNTTVGTISTKSNKVGFANGKSNSTNGDDPRRTSFTSEHRRAGVHRRRSTSDVGYIKSSFTGSSTNSSDIKDPLEQQQPSRPALLKTVTSINQRKEIRRQAMTVENQTFVPPKSRQSTFIQALGHLISGRIIELTLWTYSASFAKVLGFFLLFYILNIFLWAAVMDAVDLASGGKCIHEDPMGLRRSERYEFVFELSWATFTTVGYGTISPSGDITGCYAIRFTCAMVAFIGVLFASTTAAIMYSKLMRLLAKAHVTFSSTLCVQYGKGNEGSTVRFGQLNFRASVAPAMIMKNFSASDLLEDEDEDSPSGSDDGFPVIEFRMINDRANFEGSEIWDAQIRGIVQLHKEEHNTGNNIKFANSIQSKDKATGGGESTLDLEKKVYYPVTLSPDSHPHFSRIWYARHVLNAESPLLKREIRDMIVKDGGKWDKDFNTWEEIRDCLNEFISLRITLSGTSAVSASDVYGEHVYEFDDVCVGWRFANMVYEKREGKRKTLWRRFGFGRSLREDELENHETTDTRTKIDADLLHDIVPQPGGDHEPLHESNASMSKMFSFSGIHNVLDTSQHKIT